MTRSPSPNATNGGGADHGTRGTAEVPQLLDIAALGARLGVGERHVRRLVFERRIPFVKVGRYVRFDPDEVARWIDDHRVPAYAEQTHWSRTGGR